MGISFSKFTSKRKSSATTAEKMAPLAFQYFAKVKSDFKPPLIANENAFLGDVVSNDKIDPEKPMSCGIYRLEKGTPLVYTYTYHEMKIILEGEFDIKDETGQSVHVSRRFSPDSLATDMAISRLLLVTSSTSPRAASSPLRPTALGWLSSPDSALGMAHRWRGKVKAVL